jgi:hypothetical protein
MDIPHDKPLRDLLKSIGDAFEGDLIKFTRAMFGAMPTSQQIDTLQRAYDAKVGVAKLSRLSGFSESAIYTKIRTRK